MKDIIGYEPSSTEAGVITKTIFCCTQKAIDAIRHENIEGQTAMAFHTFARAARAMFKTGAAIELKREGYRYQKVRLEAPKTDNRFKS